MMSLGGVSVWPQGGDSGSPVYVLVYATPDRASGVKAYGILSSARIWTGTVGIATLDYTYVKLTK